MTDQAPKVTLKPCPFCGGEGAVFIRPHGTFAVQCQGCGTEGSPQRSQAEAITAWNTRSPSPDASPAEGTWEQEHEKALALVETAKAPDASMGLGLSHDTHPASVEIGDWKIEATNADGVVSLPVEVLGDE